MQQVATTDVWGPALWRAIHFIALGYPAVPTEADAAAYRAFFENLDKVIPCEVCANNYRRHFEEIPIDGFLLGPARGSGAKTLFDWTVELHGVVDRELGKAVGGDWTPERAKEALFAGRWTEHAADDDEKHPAESIRPQQKLQKQQQQQKLVGGGTPWPLLLIAAILVVAAIFAAVALTASNRRR